MGKGSSFERGDGVTEMTGGGAALSGTTFDVDGDDVLGVVVIRAVVQERDSTAHSTNPCWSICIE